MFVALSGLAGAILTILVQLVLNKRALFTYSFDHKRVGISVDHAVFGSVQVTWNDTPIANLFISTIEVRNESLKDFEGVTLRVWTTNTMLLTELTEIVGTRHVLARTSRKGWPCRLDNRFPGNYSVWYAASEITLCPQ